MSKKPHTGVSPLTAARQAGHGAAAKAANAAGDEWKAQAFAAFVKYAKTHSMFTTQDVRFANPEIVAGNTQRAWGHIALAARREGIVEFGGFTPVSSSRGGAKAVWRSLITKRAA